MVAAEDVLSFWLDEVGEKGWYTQSDALDQQIRDRFEEAWNNACDGAHALWLTYPSGTLAYIILLDQFSRNMFRDDPRSFTADKHAIAAAKVAIHRKWDLRLDEPARQFFYMPLMHSENLCDQDRCVRLMCERMPKDGEEQMIHAQAHRDVIRQFGRFPYRNAALGRASTQAEQEYLAAGGYGHTMRKLQAAAAA